MENAVMNTMLFINNKIADTRWNGAKEFGKTA